MFWHSRGSEKQIQHHSSPGSAQHQREKTTSTLCLLASHCISGRDSIYLRLSKFACILKYILRILSQLIIFYKCSRRQKIPLTASRQLQQVRGSCNEGQVLTVPESSTTSCRARAELEQGFRNLRHSQDYYTGFSYSPFCESGCLPLNLLL